MRGGICSPVSCTFIPGLGMCLRSDSAKETLWWPYLLLVAFLLTLGSLVVWWVRRSRRHRREHTAAFAATLDDTQVERKIAGVGGIFKLLHTMRLDEKSPARESFHSPDVGPADGPPPAYTTTGTTRSTRPVIFNVTPPSPTAKGLARASSVKRGHEDQHLGAFEGERRLARQVSFAIPGDSKKDSSPVDEKSESAMSVRHEHCMV
jgi:hypothetical protein